MAELKVARRLKLPISVHAASSLARPEKLPRSVKRTRLAKTRFWHTAPALAPMNQIDGGN